MIDTNAALRELELEVARVYSLLRCESRDMAIAAAKMKAAAVRDEADNADAMEVNCKEVE